MNDPLCVIDYKSGTLQFRHYITASGQFGKVDGSVCQSGVLHRAVATTYLFKSEPGVGDGLGKVCAIHLYQMDTGQTVIKKDQLPHIIPGLQFDFLGGGIKNMPIVPGIHLHRTIGPRLHILEEDFTAFIRLVFAQRNGILEHLKGNGFHSLVAGTVIFDDSERR